MTVTLTGFPVDILSSGRVKVKRDSLIKVAVAISEGASELRDRHLASPLHPRHRIGLGTTVARVVPAERPETCSRPGIRRRGGRVTGADGEASKARNAEACLRVGGASGGRKI